MNSLAKTGKIYLLVILSAVIVPGVFNVALRSLFFPQSLGGTELIRFVLTLVLVFFTYKGYPWARWIMCILLLIAGVAGTLVASYLLADNRILGILLILLSMFYALSGMSLHSSQEIQSFFEYQKNNRQK